MAKYGGSNVGFLLVGGFSLLGVTTDVTPIVKEAVTEEDTPLGVNWPTHKATGNLKGAFAQNGFFDDAAASINEAMAGLQSVARVICVAHEGNTIGKRFIGLAGAFATKFSRVLQRAGLTKANVTYGVSGELEDGVILHALTAETADGDTEGASSQDAGASSANGGAGYLQVTAISGDNDATLNVKVRHSADDVTYADLVTFTQVVEASERSAERIAVAGTVNRHLACSWDIEGTDPSATFMVGFVRH